jgi:hypothetical protein
MLQMNPQEQNEYIQALLSGKAVAGSELEAATVGQLKGISSDVAQKKLRHDALAEEVAQLKNDIKRLNGQREAYITILIMAESARRMPKRPAAIPPDELAKKRAEKGHGEPPDEKMPETTLEKIKEATGAEKVEVVDNDGNVVDGTEGTPGTAEPPDEKEEVPDGAEDRQQG